jgi:hypothetical protein
MGETFSQLVQVLVLVLVLVPIIIKYLEINTF